MINKGFIFVGLIFILSCDSNRVFEQNIKINDGNWKVSEVKKFEINILDTTSVMDVFVNVRHTSSYSYSNLWMFVNTIYPDGTKEKDTLQCVVAQASGKWLGRRGLADIWSLQAYYKTKIFKQFGIHQIEIEQAMRYGSEPNIQNLKGITDVGLRIEKNIADE
jgi:gliding motility-associated lipoprotein GldH